MNKNTMQLTPGLAPLRRIADLPGPKGHPLTGNMRDISARPFHQVMEGWAREFGALYRFRIMGKRFVVTADRETIAAILRDRPEVMRRSTRTTTMLEEVGTRGLFTAEGEEWRRQRKLVMRALTPEVIHNFFPTLTALTERLRLRWERAIAAGQPVNVLRDLKAYTLDVTIGLVMGQDINTLELEEHPLQRDIEFLFKLVARRLTSPVTYWRVPMFRRAQDHEAVAASARIQRAIFSFIAEGRKRIERNPALRAKPSNMLEALIVACDEPGSGFADAAVVGNAITMVFAGEDTTSNTAAWLIDFLAAHPQAEASMAAEAAQVLGEKQVLDDYHLLERMSYVDAATREAMRLKPVAPVMAVEPNQDTVVGDLAVPKGAVIFLLMRHASEREGGLAQPELFMPERWLDGAGANGSGGADDPARKLFPFGAGPRFCPGRYLAIAEIKMVMSMLVRNFALERVPGAPAAQECFTFTMTPDALPVRLIKKT
jgi:cytochrome P450